jgi:hypothetical protein
MPLFRSRTAVHRARFRAVATLFAVLAVGAALFVAVVAIAYVWNP